MRLGTDRIRSLVGLWGVVCLMLLLGALPSSAQTTVYVDDDNCPGPGTGTQLDPAYEGGPFPFTGTLDRVVITLRD